MEHRQVQSLYFVSTIDYLLVRRSPLGWADVASLVAVLVQPHLCDRPSLPPRPPQSHLPGIQDSWQSVVVVLGSVWSDVGIGRAFDDRTCVWVARVALA